MTQKTAQKIDLRWELECTSDHLTCDWRILESVEEDHKSTFKPFLVLVSVALILKIFKIAYADDLWQAKISVQNVAFF